MYPAVLPSLFSDVCGQRHLHVGGHTGASGTAVAMVLAKLIGAADICHRSCTSPAAPAPQFTR
jgi:hypothetical protein